MLDVTGPVLIVLLIGVYSYLPIKSFIAGLSDRAPQKVSIADAAKGATDGNIAEGSLIKQYCLTNFRAEIESSFAPRPTDSILSRHHDALIAAELDKRLAELAT